MTTSPVTYYARLAGHYAAVKVAKRTNVNVAGPMLAFIEVTKACSFRCGFCDIWRATDETTNEMTYDDLLQVIADLKELGTKYVGLFGGEPLQRKDLFDVIAAMKAAGFGVVLITNGYLLPEYHERIVRSGLDTLMVSMDSAQPELHDRLRGRKGSHARILRGLDAIRRLSSHVRLGINTIVMKPNFRELADIVRLGTEHGVRHYRFLALNFTYPYDMRGQQSSALALDQREIDELPGELESLIAYCESQGVTLNSHRFLRGIPAFYYGRNEKVDCYAGYASINIHNNGRLSFCSSLPANIGNVRQTRLRDIWRSRAFNDERTRVMSAACDKCWVSCFIEQNHWFELGFMIRRMLTAS